MKSSSSLVSPRKQGFSLLFVLVLGILLTALAGSLLVLSNAQAQRDLGVRGQVEATVRAESGIQFLIASERERLLTLGTDGGQPPEFAEDPFVLVQEDQLYFAARTEDDLLDDYEDGRALPGEFATAAFFAEQGSQRWWLQRLGPVQWRPIDLKELMTQSGLVRVAEREIIVVGEGVSGSQNVLQRQIRAQNLGFYLDLNDPLVTLKPQTALSLVPTLGNAEDPSKQPILSVRGSISVPTLIRFAGAVLLDTQNREVAALGVRGQALLDFEPSPDSTVNRQLYPTLTTANRGLWQMGTGAVNTDPQATIDTQIQNLDPSLRTTLQLDGDLATALGKQGTVYEGEFKEDTAIFGADGGLIYDPDTAQFDFNQARNGILYLPLEGLNLQSDTYRSYTYKGRGTLVVTSPKAVSMRNISLVAADSEASLTIIIAPVLDPALGQDRAPLGLQVVFGSPVTPQTVLANETDQLVTFNCSLNSRLAEPDPLVANNPLIKRTIGFISSGKVSIPNGSRAYQIDENTCVILARLEKDQTEVILSIGQNTDKQKGKVEPRRVLNAKVIPLQQIQAEIYNMNPTLTRGSCRFTGRVVTPSIRMLGGAGGNLYGVDQKDRYILEFIYQSLPATVGSLLMTFRSDLTPRSIPLPITFLELKQWRALSAAVLKGEPLEAPDPQRKEAPPLSYGVSPNGATPAPTEDAPAEGEEEEEQTPDQAR